MKREANEQTTPQGADTLAPDDKGYMTKLSHAQQERRRAALAFLCCADGEGSQEFHVALDEAGVMAFYESQFGKDYDGKLDGAIEHFRDSENWRNEGTAYECELYCAKFYVWKVARDELALPDRRQPPEAARCATCGDTITQARIDTCSSHAACPYYTQRSSRHLQGM